LEPLSTLASRLKWIVSRSPQGGSW
jgi:hypothetical protein